VVLGALSLLRAPDLSPLVRSLAAPVHGVCLTWAQPDTPLRGLYQSLACGAPFDVNSEIDAVLRQSGIFHWFVVSGFHLLLVLKMYRSLSSMGPLRSLPPWTHPAVIGLVVLFFGASAPLLRVVVGRVASHRLDRWDLHWPPSAEVATGGLLTLIFFPGLWLSYSLALSWLAALALTAARSSTLWSTDRFFRSTLQPAAWVFLLMMPVFAGWSGTHPLSILVNASLGFFFAAVLFPLSCLAAFVPGVWTVADPIWFGVFKVLSVATTETSAWTVHGPPMNIAGLWLYLFGLQWALLWFERLQRRPAVRRRPAR
jgi:hypothetical protein